MEGKEQNSISNFKEIYKFSKFLAHLKRFLTLQSQDPLYLNTKRKGKLVCYQLLSSYTYGNQQSNCFLNKLRYFVRDFPKLFDQMRFEVIKGQ